jgi:hypothetical protein
VLKLKISRTIFALLYAFMACTRTYLLVPLYFFKTTVVIQKYSLHEVYFILILDWKARFQFLVKGTEIILYITVYRMTWNTCRLIACE